MTFEEAYERANDPEYQKRIRDLCCLKNWRAKYETLLERPFAERDCSACGSCRKPKEQIGKASCDARLKEKIKNFS